MASTWMQRATAELFIIDLGTVPDNAGKKKYVAAPFCIVSVDGAQYVATTGGPFGTYGEGVPAIVNRDAQDEEFYLGGPKNCFNLSGRIQVIGEHQMGEWKGTDSILAVNKIGLI